MAKIKVDKSILKKTQREMGEMSFGEIALVVGLSEHQTEKLFHRAMAKLGSPSFSRDLHAYKLILTNDGFDKTTGER